MPVVKRTWAKDAALLEFYSDSADPDIPTTDLGVPNTESGQYLEQYCVFLYLSAVSSAPTKQLKKEFYRPTRPSFTSSALYLIYSPEGVLPSDVTTQF